MNGKTSISRKVFIEKKALWREVDGEIVVLNIDTSNYYSLNPLGSEVWKMFRAGKTIGDIILKIRTEYKVDEARARKDLNRLIDDLRKEKLITIA